MEDLGLSTWAAHIFLSASVLFVLECFFLRLGRLAWAA
jgi:hypothetical protein